VREQAERVLRSAAFVDSARMTRFLRFALEETLRGNGASLKEIVIGAAVFDRGPDYDPRLDPIVRVEARRLRTKLRTYYETDGRTDALVIELPKGGYALTFRRQEAAVDLPPVAGKEPEGSTIAVLPFSNLSAESDNAYFSDGMTEEIIHALTRIEGLRVVAWDSAARMRDEQEDIGAIRRRLDVTHVLRGSVRRDGNELRISAYLVNASSGQYLWSQTWDREFRDVLAIQAELAVLIADTLKLHLLGAREAGPVQPECYQLCLRGRFYARERTPESLRRSVICFERATAMPNAPANAWAGLADAWTLCADYCLVSPGESIPKARAAAERALELDPLSAEAQAALGLILSLYDWRWADAESRFRRALELNSGYVNTHHWYAMDFLACLGRFDEAMAEIAIAVRLDPLSPILREGQAYLFTLSRRYDEAIEHFAGLHEMDPSFYKALTSMGRALLLMGRYDEAIGKLEAGRALAGAVPQVLGALGEAYGRAGRITEARGLLARLHEIAATEQAPASPFALIHLGLGEKDEALKWLETGVERHELPMAMLNVHPVYDDLRGEPRFRELVQRIGFPRVLP
jgi:TolB-like protein